MLQRELSAPRARGGGKKPRREKQRLKPANEGMGTFADHDRKVRERLTLKAAEK